jgi:hypothetical protein
MEFRRSGCHPAPIQHGCPVPWLKPRWLEGRVCGKTEPVTPVSVSPGFNQVSSDTPGFARAAKPFRFKACVVNKSPSIC